MSEQYYGRWRANDIAYFLANFPSVVLLGPRQCGKTTLAVMLQDLSNDPVVYLDLEDPIDQAKLADPSAFFAATEGSLVILDEVQRMPDLFPVLRSTIDKRRRKGMRTNQFLLLGSSSVTLSQQSSESLAGRAIYVDLQPFHYLEVADTGDVNLNQHWIFGGFPESYFRFDSDLSFEWRKSFIRTYLERDIQLFGMRVPIETIRNFWTMLAHNQGGEFNASRMATTLGISSVTVARYLDLLTDLFLVRQIPPWHGNVGKRLTKSKKVYVRDSGITHALLNLHSMEDVLGHPVAGFSWEGYVIDNIIALLGAEARVSFYRTSNGAEIDLIIQFAENDCVALEIKRNLAPKLSKGFHIGAKDVGATERYLVYPGSDSYPVNDQTWVLPFPELMRKLASKRSNGASYPIGASD